MASRIIIQEPARPFFIRVLARIATGIQFFEARSESNQSIGALFIFWLCPKLAPTPAMHQYIISSPQRSTSTPFMHTSMSASASGTTTSTNATNTTTTDGSPGPREFKSRDLHSPHYRPRHSRRETLGQPFRRRTSGHRRSSRRLEEFEDSESEDGLLSLSEIDDTTSTLVRSGPLGPQAGETGGPGVDASALRRALTVVEFNRTEAVKRSLRTNPDATSTVDEVVVTRAEERLVGSLVDSSG